MLRPAGVQEVVDVRKIPRSRHNPQFHEDILHQALVAAGIAYCHLDTLGGLRHGQAESPNGAWRNTSFRAYADYMQTSDFAHGLRELEGSARGKRVALMCAETLPWRCHRFLIADALTAHGFVVVHLIQPGRAAHVHRLTAWAHIQPDGRILYPLSGDPAEGVHLDESH